MAQLRDWLNLGRNTIDSLKISDAARFYETEWPETKKMLIAEHRDAIDGDTTAVRRAARTSSAVLYGLTKRLAPHRRVLFFLSWISFFVCIGSIFAQMKHPPFVTFVEIVATFLVLTLLLAMELIDKIKYRDELELARDLQSGLIPKVPAQTPEFEVAAFNEIANTVGGDIYDFVPLPDGRLAVLFGDASGHGMSAGLVMAVAHAAFRTQLDIDPSPGAIINSLNRILCRTGGSRSFFACCYVLLCPDGSFTATVAGHPQVLKADQHGKIVERLGTGSYPLGIKTGLAWAAVGGRIESSERLLLHSDGLTEARNRNGREFGDAFVETIVGWNPGAPPQSLINTFVDEMKSFADGMPPEDDISIAVIQRR